MRFDRFVTEPKIMRFTIEPWLNLIFQVRIKLSPAGAARQNGPDLVRITQVGDETH